MKVSRTIFMAEAMPLRFDRSRFIHALTLSQPRRAASSRFRERMFVHTFLGQCSNSCTAFVTSAPSSSLNRPWPLNRSALGRVAMYFMQPSDCWTCDQFSSSALVMSVEVFAAVCKPEIEKNLGDSVMKQSPASDSTRESRRPPLPPILTGYDTWSRQSRSSVPFPLSTERYTPVLLAQRQKLKIFMEFPSFRVAVVPYEAHECLRSHRGVDLTGKRRI